MSQAELTSRFMALFRGMERAYGTYQIDGSSKYEGKKLGGKAVTLRKPVTLDLWSGHLAGVQGLGIIPIRDDSHCFFGAVDIDVYPLDLASVAQKIHDLKLPILPCRSKSGGVHGYVFFSEPVSAALLVPKLQEFASLLGHAGCETYPKQTQVLAERGDLGNWINMPYFGAETTRYGIKLDGSAMTAEEFLAAAEAIKIDPDSLKAIRFEVEDLKGAPPCLIAMAKQKVTAGARNTALFSFAVYARKSRPGSWKEWLKEANQRFFDPPMGDREVEGVIGSTDKKDYLYKCNESVFRPVCNAALCKKQTHGISQTTDIPELTALTKYNSDPPVWFVDVSGGGRMELSTEALQNQNLFQKRCMEVLHVMPPAVTKNSWIELISKLMEKVHVVEAPPESTPKGQLLELLEQFLTGRAQGQSRDDILTGRPWLDSGKHHFRLKAFTDFLKRQNFRGLEGHQIASAIQEAGGAAHSTTIKGAYVRYWTFPEFERQKESLDVPKFEQMKEPF